MSIKIRGGGSGGHRKQSNSSCSWTSFGFVARKRNGDAPGSPLSAATMKPTGHRLCASLHGARPKRRTLDKHRPSLLVNARCGWWCKLMEMQGEQVETSPRRHTDAVTDHEGSTRASGAPPNTQEHHVERQRPDEHRSTHALSPK